MIDLGICSYPDCGRPAVNTCSHCSNAWCELQHGAAGCKPMYPEDQIAGERNPEAALAEMRSEYRYEDDQRYQMSDAEIEYLATRDDDARPAYDMPDDGDQLGALVYRSELGAWLYDASYSDPALARRRAESLQRTFGVPFFVQHFYDAGSYAAVSVVYTPQLRAAIFERGKSHA